MLDRTKMLAIAGALGATLILASPASAQYIVQGEGAYEGRYSQDYTGYNTRRYDRGYNTGRTMTYYGEDDEDAYEAAPAPYPTWREERQYRSPSECMDNEGRYNCFK